MYTPSKVGNPVKYWDKVEKITDRADVLDAFKDISSLVDKGNLEKANEVVTDISNQIRDVSKEAADISLESRRQGMDFVFSAATPSILTLIYPVIGTSILLAVGGFKSLRGGDWDVGIDKLSKLLGNEPKRTNIVPMMLLMKNIR